jgi:hypothetical protein
MQPPFCITRNAAAGPLKLPNRLSASGSLPVFACPVRSAPAQAAFFRVPSGRNGAVDQPRRSFKTMTESTATASSKQPSHYAYHVRDRGEGKKAIWTRIGSAWSHADGKGFNLQLECTPIDGRISLRHVSEEKQS